MTRLPVVMIVAAAASLAGCTPPYIDEAHLPFAKDHYRSCGRGACATEPAAMSLDQLYAAHLYGRRFHPWRGQSGEFARRGSAAIPFVRAKLAAASDGGEIGSLFEIFQAMRRAGTFEVRSDPDLIAAIQAAAQRVKDPGYHLRDEADELETGEARPFAANVGLRWSQGLGSDYDRTFAKSHCRGCDYRAWRDSARGLPIDRLYALQRYGWEHFHPGRDIDRLVAERGSEAIPFLKTRLAVADRGLMALNILTSLEWMRQIGAFEPRSDPELMALVEAAAGRVEGDYSQWVREAAERLRSGAAKPGQEIAPFPGG